MDIMRLEHSELKAISLHTAVVYSRTRSADESQAKTKKVRQL